MEISKMNTNIRSLENQFIYPSPKGSKLIFFAPLGVGVDEENQWVLSIWIWIHKIKKLHNGSNNNKFNKTSPCPERDENG